MKLVRKIELDSIYYIEINVSYNKDNHLKLNNSINDGFDSGNLSLLIKDIEDNYDYQNVINKYGKDVSFVANCLYIYDNIPYIDGVCEACFTSSGVPFDMCFISQEELNQYIKLNNIKMNNIHND